MLALGAAAVFPAAAVEPIPLAGIVAGRVTDAGGVPQMGAAVSLYNRYERLVTRVLTADNGVFSFESLLPDTYSLRVSLASFVPAVKRNILVQPGARSFLAIHLASILSSVELVYTAPGDRAVLQQDWKWVLRGSGASRPVLRLLPGIDISDPNRPHRTVAVFSDTRGLFRVSSGDGGALANLGTQTDLGTAFALATSVFGSNELSLSGNFGYASHTGSPSAGFSTRFSRESSGIDFVPEVNLTMRQIYLPARVGSALATRQTDGIPALQTLTATLVDRHQLTDDLDIAYGSSIESVSFLNRLNYVSPFARLRWGSVDDGSLEVAFSSGAPATELIEPEGLTEAELQHDLRTLALFPRVSLRGGRAHVQRSDNLEVGYRRALGRRTVAVGAYHEKVRNAAFNADAGVGVLAAGELLPDLASNTSVFNGGRFRRTGYSASVTEQLTEQMTATVAYGYGGAIVPDSDRLPAGGAAELRDMLHTRWRHSLTTRVAGVAPGTGTRYAASYQFTDYRALHPVHLSLTHRATLEPGLNLYLRQPIPRVGLLPGRLEANAELRNILAQGYLSLASPGGQRLVLIQSPRAVRGGVSLIF